MGTKSDLENQRQVTYEEGMDKMKGLKLDLFFETSSKNDTNVADMFK